MGSAGDYLSGAGLTVAEVINLRLARKAKARAAAEQQALNNRAKFGQTKAGRAQVKAEKVRAATLLNGAKREPSGDNPT